MAPRLTRCMPAPDVLAALVLALAAVAPLPGCENGGATATSETAIPTTFPVRLGGERFELEVAADDESRHVGLGGRERIDPNGGMLFVFRFPAVRAFVMRDCLTAIDIAYIDVNGRIFATYTMPSEPPLDPATESEDAYERRLPTYSSGHPVRYVVEVAPGTFDRLGLKPGDRIGVDLDRLKAIAESVDR